jgi:hypothetical protein
MENIDSEPAVAGLEFHTGQSVGHGVGARAAVALEVHAHHPEVAELLGELLGQGGRFEPALDVRPQSGVNELTDGTGDIAFVLIEKPVDAEKFEWCVDTRSSGVRLGRGEGGH